MEGEQARRGNKREGNQGLLEVRRGAAFKQETRLGSVALSETNEISILHATFTLNPGQSRRKGLQRFFETYRLKYVGQLVRLQDCWGGGCPCPGGGMFTPGGGGVPTGGAQAPYWSRATCSP